MKNVEDMTREEILAEYGANMHAIQSAIALKMNYSNFASPKHLRVGVDSAMVSDHALTTLLIKKGVFTEEEFFQSLLQSTREELDRATKEANERTGGSSIAFG